MIAEFQLKIDEGQTLFHPSLFQESTADDSKFFFSFQKMVASWCWRVEKKNRRDSDAEESRLTSQRPILELSWLVLGSNLKHPRRCGCKDFTSTDSNQSAMAISISEGVKVAGTFHVQISWSKVFPRKYNTEILVGGFDIKKH